jgi:hypothetical protein
VEIGRALLYVRVNAAAINAEAATAYRAWQTVLKRMLPAVRTLSIATSDASRRAVTQTASIEQE